MMIVTMVIITTFESALFHHNNHHPLRSFPIINLYQPQAQVMPNFGNLTFILLSACHELIDTELSLASLFYPCPHVEPMVNSPKAFSIA